MATETKGWFKSNATSIVAIAALITPMYFMVGSINDRLDNLSARILQMQEVARQNEIARQNDARQQQATDAEQWRAIQRLDGVLVALLTYLKTKDPNFPFEVQSTLPASGTPQPESFGPDIQRAAQNPAAPAETPPPLHIAARENDAAKAQRLLGGGADVNAKYNGGETPLHAAAGEGAADVAALLLKHGADISAKDSGGATPLRVAEHKGHTKVAQLIRNHRATG